MSTVSQHGGKRGGAYESERVVRLVSHTYDTAYLPEFNLKPREGDVEITQDTLRVDGCRDR